MNWNIPQTITESMEEDHSLRKSIFTVAFYLSLPISAWHLIKYMREDMYGTAVIHLSMIGVVFILYLTNRKEAPLGRKYVVSEIFQRLFTAMLAFIVLYEVGWQGRWDNMLWSYLYPLWVYLTLDRKEASAWVVVFYVSIAYLLQINDNAQLLPQDISSLKERFLISFFLICTLSFFIDYEASKKKQELLENQRILKQSEEALRLANDRLESRVMERTGELQRVNTMLEAEIAERKRVEIALRKSEERFRILFEYAPVAYFISDLDGFFVDGNKAAAESVGYEKSEIIGKNIFEFDLLLPSELPVASELLMKNMQGEPTGPNELMLKSRDGNVITVEISTYPVNIEGRDLTLGIARDISLRKLMEEDLKKAKEAAEAASRAKSDFLANMSHELRTPLNAVSGFSEILLAKHFGPLNEIQEDYLRDISKSSEHLLSLINEVLDLSKVEAGRVELELGDVPLKDMIEDCLDMVKEDARKHRIALTSDLVHLPVIVRVDGRKLKQVFNNLLSNALKFTPDGGSVRLYAGCFSHLNGDTLVLDHPEIPLETLNKAVGQPYLKISISDTGIGIEREDLERIFYPFEQVDTSMSRKYQGTGLGLSLTKRFVEMHGGSIWAESVGRNRGSAFHLVIPLQA
ncbi:MAG: PAS domain S-box protein [Deltaproteobacteria bacterium]|nr:PAS domain S-box protein [Deltaproteobacteria bacterium]